MKNLKSRKNRKGFTLVELIVVIAILAILAGVAIPVYSGYIKEANKAADLASLDAVKTAAVSAYVMAQKDAATAVTSISYTSGAETATVNETEVTITGFTSAVTLKTGSSADWANDAWTINN